MTLTDPVSLLGNAARSGVILLLSVLALSSTPAFAIPDQVETRAGPIRVETVTEGLKRPWGLAFLPDGRMLVTERVGNLRLVDPDGTVSDPISGVPEVVARGQGGLLGVALDPNFLTNKMIYLAYSEPGENGAGTSVARGRLEDGALTDLKVIFQQTPKVSGTGHFGGRVTFAPDGTLFVTLGDRRETDAVQDPASHIGKIVRINPDGSVPQDNPFIGQNDAQPEIWSMGHRNVQGAAIDPKTGKLWTLEFGPGGGDELNRPIPGENYGWPLVSWGNKYSGGEIPDPPTRPEFVDAIRHWTPVISPSGATFYTAEPVPGWTSEAIPAWSGDLLVSGLSSESIIRLRLDGDTVADEERIPLEARIRDVVQGPDGAVYALTDENNGKILRLTPEGQ